jgi:pimeloyl-ACP methyl ester carboxylesterase
MKKIDIAGHDVGMMVAYAYAAQFPNEVNKLALLDALLAGIEPVWSEVKAQAWWFGFFSQPHSAEVVEGRMNLFLQDFFPMISFVQNSFTPQEKAEFTRAYSVKGATRASFLSFVFEQDIKDNQEFRKNKLAMPVLAMGSDHFAPLVGTTRFELATPCTPCKCATGLRYVPKKESVRGAKVRKKPAKPFQTL